MDGSCDQRRMAGKIPVVVRFTSRGCASRSLVRKQWTANVANHGKCEPRECCACGCYFSSERRAMLSIAKLK